MAWLLGAYIQKMFFCIAFSFKKSSLVFKIIKNAFKSTIWNMLIIQIYETKILKWKGLSDSRSGGVFCEWDNNEGLKVGVFSYFIRRYKCCGPNKTNFMDFDQKLTIF